MARTASPPPPPPPPMTSDPEGCSSASAVTCPPPVLAANHHRGSRDVTVHISSNSCSPRSTILLRQSPVDGSILGRALQDDELTPIPPSPSSSERIMSADLPSRKFSRSSFISFYTTSSGADSTTRCSKLVTVPAPSSQRHSRIDPEKASDLPSNHSDTISMQYRQQTRSIGYVEEERRGLKEKALWILLYLSGPCFLVSLFVLFYTIVSFVLITILLPVRLLRRNNSLRQQFIDFLAPSLRLQLCFIYTSDDPTASYNLPLLLIVHLFSPIVSIGVACAAWVSATFWIYTGILGDPDGTDKPRGYNDGKASVLGVHAWWRGWLTRALR